MFRLSNYYLSTDSTITTADTSIGFRIVSSLAAGASSTASTLTTITATLPPGVYYLGEIVDSTNVQAETNKANNTMVAVGTVTVIGGTNVALASVGAVATASSTYNSSYPASALIDGLLSGAGLTSGVFNGWQDATPNVWPDWVQINFNGSQTIDHVVVYTVQDNYTSTAAPSNTLTFSLYGITAYTVQGWNGSSWVTLGTVTNNNLVMSTVSFAPYTTTMIRINITGALATYSRLTEVQAWGY